MEGQKMGRAIPAIAIIAVVSVVFLGCSQPYMRARNDMFQGRRALDAGDFLSAEQLFVRAAQAQPSAAAYAFAATAAYNANDLQNASLFIDEAFKVNGKLSASPRMLAYKSLVLFRQGRQAEAMDAIDAYLAYGVSYYPIRNAGTIRRMMATGPIDLVYLEGLLEYDVRRYESDMAQWEGEGTGRIALKYGPGVAGVPEK